MLRVLGHGKRACDGIMRREVLAAGGLSLFGMTLADVLRAEAAISREPTLADRPPQGKARSVILLYLFGGPPLQDTFDPKPSAPREIRGEFGSVATSVPGVHFTEHLPRMASWMNRSALIRSATHPHNDHSAGLLYTMTGKKAQRLESLVPTLSSQAPSMNSVIQYLARRERRELPASVWMPCYTGWGQGIVRPGPYAGFLGRQFDPFITSCKPYSEQPAKYAHPEPTLGNVVLPDMELPNEVTLDRLDHRRTLLGQLDDERRRMDEAKNIEQFDRYQRQALQMVTSTSSPNSPWRAFYAEDEPPSVRDRYGRNLYGETVLIARRLIESGVRFVTVTWEVFEKLKIDLDGWDTHQRNFDILRERRLPVLDMAYSALCDDLDARGLLDETLIVVMGEMGRTPRINKHAGRDHWSYCYNVLLTGAGIKHGAVHGTSDRIGAYPNVDPVGPKSIIATIYAAMGIEPSVQIMDMSGRPRPIAQGGEPIREILA